MKSTRKEISPTQKMLNLWAVVLIIWAIYRAYFKTTLPIWADELIAKPLVFILPVYWYIKSIEKKPFFEGIDLSFKNSKGSILLGIGVGMVFFVTGLIATFVKSKDITHVFSSITPVSLLGYFILALATAVSEEILSRGFVLKRLYLESKNIYTSSFFASILFFFLHIPILFSDDKIGGMILLRVMFTDMILSLAVSFLYLDRRSLIVPILVHLFYNLSLTIFV